MVYKHIPIICNTELRHDFSVLITNRSNNPQSCRLTVVLYDKRKLTYNSQFYLASAVRLFPVRNTLYARPVTRLTMGENDSGRSYSGRIHVHQLVIELH